ncbi:Hypothetical predicted protein [Cloeon dipterum]|uniref:Uncharacterized protein n=1 Tax=Cloeon dipterum TaxID=197152 RepID=A0A8S1CGB7_9INSE|nr:Hypothetical predicted protein [Cloeon dipterum]
MSIRACVVLALVAFFLQEVPAFDLTGLNFGNPLAGLFGGTNKRHVRQADTVKACSWWTIQKNFLCCKFPTPFTSSDTAICATKKRGFSKGNKDSRLAEMGLACIVSCTIKRRDSLYENGTANVEKLRAQFLASTPSNEWKTIINGAFDTCLDQLQYADITKEGDCQMTNLHFAYCLYSIGVRQCPEDSRTSLEECYVFFENVANGKSKCNPWPAPVNGAVGPAATANQAQIESQSTSTTIDSSSAASFTKSADRFY